ncbi:hypothetical protein, partial [Candidatus Phytoplasma asteris]|uniref:hypothetical protein n=1 Tax=Candidatus Phytoplasma asteris TaxID=85620 RepID=UPI0039DF8C4E
ITILWFLHDILPQLKDVSIPDATQCGLSTFGSNIIVFLTTTYLFVSYKLGFIVPDATKITWIK